MGSTTNKLSIRCFLYIFPDSFDDEEIKRSSVILIVTVVFSMYLTSF